MTVVIAEGDGQEDESQRLDPFFGETQQGGSRTEKVYFLEPHLEEGRFEQDVSRASRVEEYSPNIKIGDAGNDHDWIVVRVALLGEIFLAEGK
ncbi:hypothetical protein AXF42_Ash005903 [Apostasia shenzhenica]|uniref:Uncharacterized protein n=1 Tax=Apostasia shenzhenica TaxID=1088818 RepID=A0A2I0BCP0_9ASPA|nr:hypothetical protein AXF42_Ash005903 [Apostasia shenzhenica]